MNKLNVVQKFSTVKFISMSQFDGEVIPRNPNYFNKHLDRIGKSSTLKSALLQCWPKNYSPALAGPLIGYLLTSVAGFLAQE